MVQLDALPDADKHYPDPDYLRGLIELSGLSMRHCASRIGVRRRTLQYYLSGERECPYSVQYALEQLAGMGD